EAAKGTPTDTYAVELKLDEKGKPITAIALDALPHESLPHSGPGHANGNFVITGIQATLAPPPGYQASGRYLRIEIPGKQKILSLAEVQVVAGADNVAVKGAATQSSTAFEGPAKLAIDGNVDGAYDKKSVTHTAASDDPWWELDL